MLCTLNFAVFVSLITSHLLFPTEAYCYTDEKGVKIFEANLTSGSSYIKTGGTGLAISWLRNLGTNQGSEKNANLQGVVRITFPLR